MAIKTWYGDVRAWRENDDPVWRPLLSININWLAFGGGWRWPRVRIER